MAFLHANFARFSAKNHQKSTFFDGFSMFFSDFMRFSSIILQKDLEIGIADPNFGSFYTTTNFEKEFKYLNHLPPLGQHTNHLHTGKEII